MGGIDKASETGNPFSPGFDVGGKPIFVHPNGDVIHIFQ